MSTKFELPFDTCFVCFQKSDDNCSCKSRKIYEQGKSDMITEVIKELHRLCNTDCPQGCYCVDNQECCPYLECIADINDFLFLKQLNGDI